jgi:hypothetical protein
MPDDHDALVQRFRELLDNSLGEQAVKHMAELTAGVDAERAEEIDVWFRYHRKSLARSREARLRFLN